MSQQSHGDAAGVGKLGDEQDKLSSALELFAESLRSFQAMIPPDERAAFDQFSSCKSMLDVIEAQAAKNPERSRLLRCCKKISQFAERWEPFFEITNILVSSKPEWAALAWGAIRLVFKLCGHYTVFFEKLADMLDGIATKLPHFGRHIELFTRRKRQRPDLQRHAVLVQTLGYMFKDIMLFCQEACNIFRAKDRGVRYKLNVIKDIFWKPFDVRFSDLLARLGRYEKMYELELSLASQEELMGHYEGFDAFVAESNREREFREGQSKREEALALRRQARDIKTWIQAPEYMPVLERERGSTDSGSYLLGNETYAAWRQSWMESRIRSSGADPPPKALFIYGSPGYGKTVLSVKAIEDLESESDVMSGEEKRTVAFFHFDKMNSRYREPSQALRAILCQIIHKHQDDTELVDAATVVMDVQGSGQATASESDVAVILKLFLERYMSTALVFDGIDECLAPKTFLDKLSAICWSSNCKLLLFSRPNVPVPIAWQHHCQQVRLHLGANTHDIAAYVRPRMEQLLTSELVPALDIELAVGQVAQRANSIFLWARVLMDYLECPALTPGDRLRAISHLYLLEGLNPLYTEILETIQKKFKEERDTAYRAFQLITVARRPLKISELRTALAVQAGKSLAEQNHIANFQQSLLQICGALVELHQDSTVHFIHLSAKEFLTDARRLSEPGGSNVFYIDIAVSQISTASLCLSYIMRHVPHNPLSGSSTITAHVPHVESRFPLLRYALDWPAHAIEGLKWQTYSGLCMLSLACLKFARVAQEFLQTKRAVAVWFESMWLFGNTPHIRNLVVCLSDESLGRGEAKGPRGEFLDGQTLNVFLGLKRGLGLLADDYEYLDKEWAHLLAEEPCEIWGPSINMFHTSELMIGTEAGSLVPTPGTLETQSEQDHPASDSVFSNEVSETLLLTQVSQDGERIGSVFLVPPEQYLQEEWSLVGPGTVTADGAGTPSSRFEDDESDSDPEFDISPLEACERIPLVSRLSTGWRARIQIQPTGLVDQPQKGQLVNVLVDIPPDHIFQMLMLTLYNLDRGQCSVPAAFSPDLKTIVVLRCVVRLTPDGHILQSIDSEGIRRSNDDIHQQPLSFLAGTLDLSDKVWYGVSFSPSGRYFAAIRSGPSCSTDVYESHGQYYNCSVAVFEDLSHRNGGGKTLSYEEIAYTDFMDEIGGVSTPVTFHPSAPCLAIGSTEAVYLWEFGAQDERPKKIFEGGIDNLTFSPTGSILGGERNSIPIWFEVDYENIRYDDMESPAMESPWEDVGETSSDDTINDRPPNNSNPTNTPVYLHNPTSRTPDPDPDPNITSNSTPGLDLITALIKRKTDPTLPTIQSSHQTLTLSTPTGTSHSRLTTEHLTGAIILQATTDNNQPLQTADLLRLPQSILHEKFSTTIITNNTPSIRLVLNKTLEPIYDFSRRRASPTVNFPVVVDRCTDSIPVFGTKRTLEWKERPQGGGGCKRVKQGG